MRSHAWFRGALSVALVGLVGFGVASHAYGEGVGLVVTSKSIPESTVEVIDPESGTSSGGGTTDVRLAAGDIISFQFEFFPVPDKQIHGLNGWLTEYIPPNTEVVGVRLIDDNGATVLPRYPGIASNDCGSGCNGYDSVPCSSGTCNLDDGSISQLYADTGVFYTTDSRLVRDPDTQFINLNNGLLMDPEPTQVGAIDGILSTSAPYYAHNSWDYAQVLAFGIANSDGNVSGNSGKGNTPFGYGSPVAGPETHYSYEATGDSIANIEFNDVVGPWNRIQYPRSTIGAGVPVNTTNTEPTRTLDEVPTLGHDLKPANPLPASAKALRFALGEIRVGEPINAEVTLRVLGTPIDDVQMADVDCGEAFGGDTSARSATGRADDNPWGLYLNSPACVFLNLLFDLDSDVDLATTGDNIEFTLRTKNLSINPQDNVWVRQKYDDSRVALAGGTTFPDMAPTCEVDDCDGDGLACLFWDLGTMAPSEEVSIRSNFNVGGGGHTTHVMRADYSSATLGTVSGNPCAGGSVTDPGFRTQKINMTRAIGIVEAALDTTTASASPGGTADLSGEIRVTGTNNAGVDQINPVLPAGWTIADGGGPSTPDIVFDGTRFECSSDCATNTPKFTGIGADLDPTSSGGVDARPLSFSVNVDGGASGLNDIDLQIWGSQTAFGGSYETYFPDLATVPVSAPRSTPPVVSCPVLSTETCISGSTTEADGTVIRVYLNGIERGSDTAAGGTWTVCGFGRGSSFGTLYGGIEVRATAQASGELESEKSAIADSCFVSSARECSDGIDNDGDGFVDFPADPGCSGPLDPREDTVECDDGVDNDGDGHVDFPDDPGCFASHDGDESDLPACSDGIDNDGDGDVDGADPDCMSSDDRTEVTLAACMNGVDDDGDGLADYPDDPGCHGRFDDDELDPAFSTDDIRARMMLVFDTSGSMNWNTCERESFTGGDGSTECPGSDVGCATCSSGTCGDSFPNDSRLFKAKAGVSDAVAAFGEVEYSLMRYHQQVMQFDCAGENATLQSGGWQGAGLDCGGFNAGDVLVDFSQENPTDVLAWMDNDDNYPGATAPPGFDRELRGSGTTPIAGSLDSARDHLEDTVAGDSFSECRPYSVILLTDGEETCSTQAAAETAAADLNSAGFPVYVLGFAIDDAGARSNLDAIASNGGTSSAIFVDDEVALSAALADIVGDSILSETCNGLDDDCDGAVDEGVTNACGGCGPVPDETCNGADDDCDGAVDEGVDNACGGCGPTPGESCDGVDNDCDGVIDEGGVCDGCVIESEICDNEDNDCDGFTDEGLTRGCGTDAGECTAGTETCSAGTWGECSGTGPSTEVCDGVDNDCDGTIDGITEECGTDVGACEPGTRLCTAGSFGTCEGAIGPSAEVCDGVDNDCDGSVDEENPGGGASCGSDIGACSPGSLTCLGGTLTCTGGTGPSSETCDGVDEDCDGATDEGVPTGGSCGACGEGVLTCVGGSMECTGDRAPSTEVCDSIDNDCDGSVDEENPGGGAACGDDTGECELGTTECSGGSLTCTGGVGPEAELCDTLDNDCDGVVDEGNPEGGTSCGDTDVGECEFGAEACVDGSLECVGAAGPSAELCDGLDNDCDGSVDEGDPEAGDACGDDTGACESGTTACVGGELICDGAVGPSEEVCNAIDDDCDGVVDDGIPVGAPCGTDTGECLPGNFICRDGELVCDGGIEPNDEVCDLLDNDCDGSIDEELPLGEECGDAEGLCEPGMTQCVDGTEICVGEVPKEPEVCDCEDNDCDGAVDEMPEGDRPLCPGDSVCVDCQCATPCSDSEFGPCPTGRIEVEIEGECYCVSDSCDDEVCAGMTVERDGETRCAPETSGLPECECQGGECTFPCDGVVCTDPLVCKPSTGRCVMDNCLGLGCPDGQLCDADTLECMDDPCADVDCAEDEACRLGTCEPSCATVECADGEVCESGECVEDLCAEVSCGAREVCDPETGDCVEDMCRTVRCPDGTVCDPVDGTCPMDPCTGLDCPEGEICRAGECELDDPVVEDGGMPMEDGGMTMEDGGEPDHDAGRVDAGDDEERVLATGGGGCDCRIAGSGSPPTRTGGGLLLALAVLGFLARRRREK